MKLSTSGGALEGVVQYVGEIRRSGRPRVRAENARLCGEQRRHRRHATVNDGRHAARMALLGNYMGGSFVTAAVGGDDAATLPARCDDLGAKRHGSEAPFGRRFGMSETAQNLPGRRIG
jgi:hypothetical protein